MALYLYFYFYQLYRGDLINWRRKNKMGLWKKFIESMDLNADEEEISKKPKKRKGQSSKTNKKRNDYFKETMFSFIGMITIVFLSFEEINSSGFSNFLFSSIVLYLIFISFLFIPSSKFFGILYLILGGIFSILVLVVNWEWVLYKGQILQTPLFTFILPVIMIFIGIFWIKKFKK